LVLVPVLRRRGAAIATTNDSQPLPNHITKTYRALGYSVHERRQPLQWHGANYFSCMDVYIFMVNHGLNQVQSGREDYTLVTSIETDFRETTDDVKTAREKSRR